MEWFFNLEPEEQVFIKKFLLASGSLKQLAKEYEVSYPTVRLRLDRLIEKIKLFDIKQEDSFEVSMMQLVINEKISIGVGKEIIKKHRESIDE